MQPVIPYREETYPPSDPMWPQFGEHGLSHSLSVTEEARQHLVQKRQEMLPMHQERLDYHRMTPAFSMSNDEGVPTVEAPRETMEQGVQASEPRSSAGTQTQRRPFQTEFGMGGRYSPPQAQEMQTQTANMTAGASTQTDTGQDAQTEAAPEEQATQETLLP